MTAATTGWTVGAMAERSGVTVRTLHHYDEIGLLVPSDRSPAGYRLYADADALRLQHIVVYRRLGFALDAIATLLDDPHADVVEHLRRQRSAVVSRLDELSELVGAIDRALEAEMSGPQLTPEEKRELFGDAFSDEYAREAEERWGDTEAWRQSQERTARYTKDDWERMKAEGDAVEEELAASMRAGEPSTSERAMDAAEAHRRLIDRWHYDMSHEMHRCVTDMFVTDERFTAYYDTREPGLAAYVRDAAHANADRQPSR